MQGKDNSDKFGYFMHSELVQATLEHNKTLQCLHLEVSLAVPLTNGLKWTERLINRTFDLLNLSEPSAKHCQIQVWRNWVCWSE